MNFLELDPDLPQEARKLAEEARKFGRSVMRPAGIALDRMPDPVAVIADDSVLWPVVREYRERGFHRLMIPEAFGGIRERVPPVTGTLLSEQLGHGDAGLAVSLIVSGLPFAMAPLFPDAGIRKLAREYTEDRDGRMIGCWGITEPAHGSDWPLGTTAAGADPRLAPTLQAVKKGKEFVLNGQKSAWVSNGTIATHAMLHVGLDPSLGMHGQALAFCPLNLPGISRGKPLDKIGQRALNQGEIFFSEVVLPRSHFLFTRPLPGGDSPLVRGSLGIVNGETSVIISGLVQAAYEEAVRYVRNQENMETLLQEEDHLAQKLFEMFAETEAVRAYVRRAARFRESILQPDRNNRAVRSWLGKRGITYTLLASWLQLFFRAADVAWEVKAVRRRLTAYWKSDRARARLGTGKYGVAAKILATEAAFRVASAALEIAGEAGLTEEYPIEKMVRDARASMIEDGCNRALALAAAEDLV